MTPSSHPQQRVTWHRGMQIDGHVRMAHQNDMKAWMPRLMTIEARNDESHWQSLPSATADARTLDPSLCLVDDAGPAVQERRDVLRTQRCQLADTRLRQWKVGIGGEEGEEGGEEGKEGEERERRKKNESEKR